MKKTEMLKKNYEFRKVLSKGKIFIGKNIEIFILKNNKNINFLGIAVSTKKGKAFQRNRIKRLIRESYKSLEKSITLGNSIIILIQKKVDIKKSRYLDIYEDMINLFDKAKIVNKEE